MAASSEPIVPSTSISVGLLIAELLNSDAAVAAIATKVYPVVAEEKAVLPYVCFRRAEFDRTLNKPGGADAVSVECLCYAKSYGESIRLAEAVRACLDHKQATYSENGTAVLVARSMDLIGAEEGWADDAYAQSLVFLVRINNV